MSYAVTSLDVNFYIDDQDTNLQRLHACTATSW